MANGVIDLRRQGPSTGAQIADLGQNMLQFFMQREQLELQKEQQGLREKAFKQDMTERQAEQQRIMEAQQGQAAALETFLAQNPQAAQQLQQAGVQVPDGAGAAPLLQGLQQQQQAGLQQRATEAQIAGTEAQTEATRAQTEIAQARLPLERRKLELEERLAGIRELAVQSEAELNRAQIAKLETERRTAPIQIANDIVTQRRQDFQSAMRDFQDPAMASFIAYGQPTRPNERAMAEQIAGTVSSVIQGPDFDPSAARQLALGDPATDLAQRLGIPVQAQAAYQAGLEQLGPKPSPKAVNDVFNQTLSAIDASQSLTPEQKEAQKGAALFFFRQQTGIPLNVPEKKGWFEALKNMLQPLFGGGGATDRQQLLEQRRSAR